MPHIYVHRGKRGLPVQTGGTQSVSGTLTLGNPTTVTFNPSTFTAAGIYTIFTYGTLVGDVSYLVADLTGTGFSTATFADTGSSITVTLS